MNGRNASSIRADVARRHICFIVGTLTQGGAERQLYYMVRTLRDHGDDVTVLCLTRGEYWESRIESLGVSVVFVGQQRSRARRLLKIVREVKRLRPDVIQSSHFYTNVAAAVAGSLFRTPAIGALRMDGLKEVSDLGKLLGALNLKGPRLIAVNSRAGLANAHSLGVPEQRLFFLPNVVDCAEFRVPVREKRCPIRVLTAGRLVEQKRHDRFLRLVARLRAEMSYPIKAMIAGSGPKRGELERQMVELGLGPADVEFCGVREDMRTLYGQADMLVLTSDWEGTPNVVLEAMASGLPVVSTAVGDVPELIENGVSGFLVSRNDEDDLAGRVRLLIQDPDRRQAIGQTARRQIETNHSLPRLFEHLNSLHSAAASSDTGTARCGDSRDVAGQ